MTQWIPFRLFMLHRYQEGTFPLWNPYIFGGMPFWSYSHTMSAYPIMGLSLVFPLLPGMCAFYLFHIWLSCWGAFRLLRHFGFDRILCFLGTLLVVGSGSGMKGADFYLILAALSFFPALIYIGIRLLETGRRRYLVLWIVLLSLQFMTGDVESAAYSTATVFLFAIVAWPGFRESLGRGHWVAGIGSMGVSVLIASLMWLPLCEYMPHNIRSGGVTLEIYRLFPRYFLLKPVIIGALIHPLSSPFGWPVLFFGGYHLAVKREGRSWVLLAFVIAGYFFSFRESVFLDKLLYNIPLLNIFLRRDQVSGGVFFLIHWLSLLGMRDFIESADSDAVWWPLRILSWAGILIIIGVIGYFEFSAPVLGSLLVYLPFAIYGFKKKPRPLGRRLATAMIALLLLSTHYLGLVLSVRLTEVERTTSESFARAAQRYDTSSRHLFATYQGHGDPELIPQQGMIFDWPQVWGWNRVPPRRYMDLIRLIDPEAIKYEDGKLSDMRFVFLHLDGALLRPEGLPLLDLLNLKYLFDHNMPVKLVSPSYVVWTLERPEFRRRRVKEQWRDLLVLERPLKLDIFVRHGQSLVFSLAWNSCSPTGSEISCPVIIKSGSQNLLEETLRLPCAAGGSGESSSLAADLGALAGSIRTVEVSVECPGEYDLDRLRFHRIRIEDPRMPFQLIHSNNYDLYENQEVLPPAFLVYAIRLLPDKDSMLRELKGASREQLAATAFLIDGPEARQAKQWLEGTHLVTYGQSRVIEEDRIPGRRVYTVQSGRRGLLVLSQNRLPGWRLRVDGEERPLLGVDWALTGVPVEAGNHRVELSYGPAGFRVALWVSVGSIFFLLAVALVPVRRKSERQVR